MKGLKSHKHVGFKHGSLHKKREPHAIFYLKQKTSFWVAVMSVFTFTIGNMMGQHGWYTFWASVLGEGVEIAYVGTGLPVKEVVDYGCWAKFGGDYKVHTFRQAPSDCKKPMPQYTSAATRDDIFSMQYMSSYTDTTEGSGHHSGVDIRIPVGTPISAVMNGRVKKVGDQPRGFGKYIVLEHPNVPNPNSPSSTTTLYSNHGHLSSILVEVGEIVQKGDTIAYSGNTGYSTGPHLDFMIMREDVPYLPYYPTNSQEGYDHTVSPLLYVQSNYDPVNTPSSSVVARSQRRSRRADNPDTVVVPRRVTETNKRAAPVVAQPDPTPEQSRKTVIARLQSRREARIRERMATIENRKAVAQTNAFTTGLIAPDSTTPEPTPRVAAENTVIGNRTGKVATVEIRHDGYFKGPRWEKVRVWLLDTDGNRVTDPILNKDITVRIAHGKGKVSPATLSPLDFVNGEAIVNVLPQARTPLVLSAFPFNVISETMKFTR